MFTLTFTGRGLHLCVVVSAKERRGRRRLYNRPVPIIK